MGPRVERLLVRLWHLVLARLLRVVVPMLVPYSSHVTPVESLTQHHLVLLVLHLDLSLVITELLEDLPLLLLGQVLTQEELRLLPEELHLRHLIQFLHLVQLLQLQKCLDLSM